MKLSTRLHRLFAGRIWNPLPGIFQRAISEVSAWLYSTRWSARLIAPFCERYGINQSTLTFYRPSSGASDYQSFQDFFTRKLSRPLTKTKAEALWPCQGYVCDYGLVKNFDKVSIKGEKHLVRFIFGSSGKNISDDHYFINIFLHNHNYHRFHSPIDGTIVNIEYIKGKLTFLRPWLYRSDKISLPAFKNERIVIEIMDKQQRSWFVTFVGGMGVGKIHLHEKIRIGAELERTEEIGYFLLGSTCCLAIPLTATDTPPNLFYLKKVQVGENLL